LSRAASQPARDPRERQKGRNRLRRAQRQAAEPSRQHNFVDPDSRVMKDNAPKCFVRAYNAQIATDAHAQVIVAAKLPQQTTDRQQLLPMAAAVLGAADRLPDVLVADAGYGDTTSLRDPLLVGVQVLVSPDSQLPTPAAPLPPNAPRNEDAVRMRKARASEAGKALYGRWKATVEPVFGQINESRNIRRFRLRTLKKASCEWKLIGATHNLLKLFRHRTAQRPKKGAGSGIVGSIRRPRTESDRRSAFPNTSTLSHSHRNRRASGQRRRFYSDRLSG
jgi:hypothetical protein